MCLTIHLFFLLLKCVPPSPVTRGRRSHARPWLTGRGSSHALADRWRDEELTPLPGQRREEEEAAPLHGRRREEEVVLLHG
jgi:hypothetical protein